MFPINPIFTGPSLTFYEINHNLDISMQIKSTIFWFASLIYSWLFFIVLCKNGGYSLHEVKLFSWEIDYLLLIQYFFCIHNAMLNAMLK